MRERGEKPFAAAQNFKTGYMGSLLPCDYLDRCVCI